MTLIPLHPNVDALRHMHASLPGRQTGRRTDRQAERQIDRQAGRHICRSVSGNSGQYHSSVLFVCYKKPPGLSYDFTFCLYIFSMFCDCISANKIM